MTLFLAALAASYLVVLLIGLLGGLYLNRGMRRLPEHPALRIYTPGMNGWRGPGRASLRLVNPPPYDQDRETRLGG